MSNRKRPLKVFLSHAPEDISRVRNLCNRLKEYGIEAWLDLENLLPGQNGRAEVSRVVREADIVIICLSNTSITSEGSVQREIKLALDVAKEKPDDLIFIIPARLEECKVPEQMRQLQSVDMFREDGNDRLMKALRAMAEKIGGIKPIPTVITHPIGPPTRPSIPPIQKPKITLLHMVLLVLIAGGVILIASAIWTLIAKSTLPTTGSISLSDAKIEFEITTSKGTQTVGPFGVLSLHKGDQVNIETKVRGPNDVPYTGNLKFKYFLAPGKSFSGKVAPYTANQSRLISVEITDQATSETIIRTFRINVD